VFLLLTVLNIVVRDKRFGGLSRPIIGSVRIPLSIPQFDAERVEALKGANLGGEEKEEEEKEEEEKEEEEGEEEGEGEVEVDGGSLTSGQSGKEWWKAKRPFLDEELETVLSGVYVEVTNSDIVKSLVGGGGTQDEVQSEGKGKGKSNANDEEKGSSNEALFRSESEGHIVQRVTGRLASNSVPACMFDPHTGERILNPNDTYAVVLDAPTDGTGGGDTANRMMNVRGSDLKLGQSGNCPIQSFQLTKYKQASTFAQMTGGKYNALGSSRRGRARKKGKKGMRSVFSSMGTGAGGTRQTVGIFKGAIRVLIGTDPPAVDNKWLEELLRPQAYVVRCYFLTVRQLAKKDKDIFGRDEASDPYLKGRIGQRRGISSRGGGYFRGGSSRWRRGIGMGGRGSTGSEGADGGEDEDEDEGYPSWFNDRQHFLENVEDEGDYHRMIQLQCTLPGASKLEISCLDYDTLHIGPDDLIGTTAIDLEDRVFDQVRTECLTR
jgi:hypothetical protein